MKQLNWTFWGIIGLILVILLFALMPADRGTPSALVTYAGSRKPASHKSITSAARPGETEEMPQVEQPAPGKVSPAPEQVKPHPQAFIGHQDLSFGEILRERGIPADTDFTIVVQKRAHILSLYYRNEILKTYHMEIGNNGLGDKEVSGDHKTPEGIFYVTQKIVYNPPDHFLGTRWLRLSYPNMEDAQRGLKAGIIDYGTYETIHDAIRNGKTPPQYTALGGGVGIHGGTSSEFGSNWTWGCVGLTNRDVNDFYDYIKVGTPVVIRS